jgi:hypothetical protein
MLRATDDHRRARIARRHGLHADHRYDSIEAATTAMTAWHATEPSTPHLSLHARVRRITVADVEAALYDERSIVRTMAMRRTLWLVTRDLLPAVVGGPGRRVAEAERRRLAKEAVGPRAEGDRDWIRDAGDLIVDYLAGREASTRQLRDALPLLGGSFTAAPGTKWSADVALMTRLLTILMAEGVVVRGRNAGHWRISRPVWTATASWLREPIAPLEPAPAYSQLVERLLHTFGPVTEDDLTWWLGSTKGSVRSALAGIDAVQVLLDDGSTGWVANDDTGDLVVAPSLEPWVALLPTLDPTTMGWRERRFYLDPAHTPYLFDSVGNGGTTVWVDGRVVGCWVQDAHERVRLVLREEVPPDARRRLQVEVDRLDEFLGGEHITNVFASPQVRRERVR